MDLRVEIKKVRPNAILPKYGSKMAAGLDLTACIDEPVQVFPQEPPIFIPTGIAFHIGDPYFVALIFPRSGLGHREGLVLGNTVGVIDADYQGEVMISAYNRNQKFFGYEQKPFIQINPGDRIAQIVFLPIARVNFAIVEGFTASSERGAGGWGSTGIQAA